MTTYLHICPTHGDEFGGITTEEMIYYVDLVTTAFGFIQKAISLGWDYIPESEAFDLLSASLKEIRNGACGTDEIANIEWIGEKAKAFAYDPTLAVSGAVTRCQECGNYSDGEPAHSDSCMTGYRASKAGA